MVASECFAGIVAKFRDRFIPLALKYFRKDLLCIEDEKIQEDPELKVTANTEITELLTLKSKKSSVE